MTSTLWTITDALTAGNWDTETLALAFELPEDVILEIKADVDRKMNDGCVSSDDFEAWCAHVDFRNIRANLPE